MKKNLRIATNLNTRSVRDCSGNPALHHILLFLYIYYLHIQWCDADWSEKPGPAPFAFPDRLFISLIELQMVLEAPKLLHQSSQTNTIRPLSSVFCPLNARGMYISFEYDALDRITKLTPSDGTPPTEYHYDQPTTQSSNALGKLTKITGEFGTIELGYDTKGAENYRVHTIDDIKAYLKTETDSHGRLTSRTLPDGTKLRYDYAPSGHMVRVGMDTSDGNSINHTVAQYAGPIVEDNKFYLERRTGNNVSTKIEFDPLRRGSEESFYRLVRHSWLKSRSSTSCLAGKTISSSLRLSNIEILSNKKDISRFRLNNILGRNV